MTTNRPIISTTLAHSIGADCASDWLNRAANPTIPVESAAWRARCYAGFVYDECTDQADFLHVLAAWEQGFDSTLPPAGQHRGALDRLEHLSRKALQLSAMLTITYGAGFETFQGWNDTIQENYLWACADMAEEISALAEAAEAAHCARRAT